MMCERRRSVRLRLTRLHLRPRCGRCGRRWPKCCGARGQSTVHTMETNTAPSCLKTSSTPPGGRDDSQDRAPDRACGGTLGGVGERGTLSSTDAARITPYTGTPRLLRPAGRSSLEPVVAERDSLDVEFEGAADAFGIEQRFDLPERAEPALPVREGSQVGRLADGIRRELL